MPALSLPRLLRSLVLFTCLTQALPAGGTVAFPLRVSEDHRTLVDASGRRFFVHGEAAWLLGKHASLEQAREYLELRAREGFNTLLLHAVSKEVTPPHDAAGEMPFAPAGDILRPNERYWAHLDALLELAEQKGFLVAFAPLWLRWGGTDQQGWRGQLTEANARAYGEFVGRRFAVRRNILWVLGGDSEPGDRARALDLMAAGIHATAPHQLLTLHGGPENAIDPKLRPEAWIDVEALYSYRETALLAGTKWRGAGFMPPARPMLLLESGYEKESNDHRGGTPARIRRQYYGAVLSGALAGHAYGHREIWKFSPQWRRATDDDGSRTLRHAVALFTSLEWWRLNPDLQQGTFESRPKDSLPGRLVLSARGQPQEASFVSAAVADHGDFAVLYIPEPRPIALDLAVLHAPAGIDGAWIDPTSGERKAVRFEPGRSSQIQVLTPPLKNFDGDADWVLLLTARAP